MNTLTVTKKSSGKRNLVTVFYQGKEYVFGRDSNISEGLLKVDSVYIGSIARYWSQTPSAGEHKLISKHIFVKGNKSVEVSFADDLCLDQTAKEIAEKLKARIELVNKAFNDLDVDSFTVEL